MCTYVADLNNEQKLQVMTDLRDGIVAHEDLDLDETIVRLGKELGTDAEKVVIEALQGKSVEDGRNLLMYAAANGFERGFRTLIEEMLKRVSSTTFCFSTNIFFNIHPCTCLARIWFYLISIQHQT